MSSFNTRVNSILFLRILFSADLLRFSFLKLLQERLPFKGMEILEVPYISLKRMDLSQVLLFLFSSLIGIQDLQIDIWLQLGSLFCISRIFNDTVYSFAIILISVQFEQYLCCDEVASLGNSWSLRLFLKYIIMLFLASLYLSQ